MCKQSNSSTFCFHPPPSEEQGAITAEKQFFIILFGWFDISESYYYFYYYLELMGGGGNRGKPLTNITIEYDDPIWISQSFFVFDRICTITLHHSFEES